MDPAGSGRAIINIAVDEIDLLPRGKGRRHKITARTFLSDKHQQRTFFCFRVQSANIDPRCSVKFEGALFQSRFSALIYIHLKSYEKTDSIHARSVLQTNQFSGRIGKTAEWSRTVRRFK